MTNHTLMPERCPGCCSVPEGAGAIGIAGHRFHLPPGKFNGDQLIKMVNPQSVPIGIRFKHHKGNKIKVDIREHRRMLRRELIRAEKLFQKAVDDAQ